MQSPLSDDELTDRWETQALGGSGVSHIDHVRVAWVLHRRHGRLEAEERLVLGTRKGCDHYGVPEKFDERLTRRWARAISSAIADAPDSESFLDFIARNPELRRGDLYGKPGEVPLAGGRVNPDVVRVGETVRRPMGARASFIHDLLVHLGRFGFDGAPRFLGVDDVGREIVSLLPGAPIPGTEILSDSEIQSAATLFQRYHDAAAGLPDAVLDGHETVIHGDAGPWNILWVDGQARALIDFDEARPGERLEDVGYFAWKGLRLVADGPSVSEQRRRLAILAETYGVDVDGDLLDAIEDAVAKLAAKGRAERWSNGVLTQLEEERAWQRQIRGRLR